MADNDAKQENMVVRSKVKEIVAQREREWGRRITNRELAKATEMREQTISNWMSPEPVERIHIAPAQRLAAYLGVRWYELFIEEPVAK